MSLMYEKLIRGLLMLLCGRVLAQNDKVSR
jgi:hypothetical protein